MTTPSDTPQGIDPMQDPFRPGYFMNYAANETEAEMVLRKLACWLSVGGYNAPKVDAEQFHRKIVDGINSIIEVEVNRRLEDAASAMTPSLRSMISRGEAAQICRQKQIKR